MDFVDAFAIFSDLVFADKGHNFNKTMKYEIISHWHPNLTLNVVYDYTPWVPGQVPPPLDEFVEFTPSLQNYKPILWINDYWNLNRDYQPINTR